MSNTIHDLLEREREKENKRMRERHDVTHLTLRGEIVLKDNLTWQQDHNNNDKTAGMKEREKKKR